ncbi:MAG: redoxin domain-containing protein [Planctomycetes bacterium]|nr:redoxin domain-containing protein [Planctomycetota bacterium]
MSPALLSLAVCALAAAPLDDAPATELRYRGTLVQVGQDADNAAKTFTVYALVRKANEQRELVFLVEERGGGGWAWPERFGRVQLDQESAPQGKERIRLLHTHDGVQYPLELVPPLFEFAGKLEEGSTWIDGKLEYEVVGKAKRQGHDCWQVEASTNFGRNRTLWVESGTGLVVEAKQRVFMGQGDRFDLSLELESVKPLDDDQVQRVNKPVATLLKLQQDLKRKADTTRPELNDEQLKTTLAALDAVAKESAETPFADFAADITRDAREQAQRAGDVGELAKSFVGKPAPKFELQALTGQPLDPAERAGKVVLLHFWKYHDDPLTEPYGQVGYIEFLKSQMERRKLPVVVYGVAVDPRLGDDATRTATVRQVHKLIEFMNLSYPIAADEGTLLRKFGDPRRVGANLPLWMVIGADGTVLHYHAGFYDIKPDEGLKQLEAAILEAVRKQRGK